MVTEAETADPVAKAAEKEARPAEALALAESDRE